MGEMPAVIQGEPQKGVAGLHERHVDRVVGLGAGVGLDVYVLGPEDLFRPVYSELLADIHFLTSTVVPLARIALGVLVGQYRANRLQYRLGNEVLRGDHLQGVALALQLAPENLVDLGVHLRQRSRHVSFGQIYGSCSYPTLRSLLIHHCSPSLTVPTISLTVLKVAPSETPTLSGSPRATNPYSPISSSPTLTTQLLAFTILLTTLLLILQHLSKRVKGW